jgi:PAS domain S-box-containing protein
MKGIAEPQPVASATDAAMPVLDPVAATSNRTGSILEAVANAALELLAAPSWPQAVPEVLARVGRAVGVSRVYILENESGPNDPSPPLRYEWCDGRADPQADDPAPQRISFRERGLHNWELALRNGEAVTGHAGHPSGDEEHLNGQDVKSFLLVPVFAGQDWWGVVGLEECIEKRTWSPAEVGALDAAARALGAAIQRQRSEEARHQAEDRYRHLVEESPDAILVHRSGVIAFANSAAARLLGARTTAELIGHSVLKLIHDDDRPATLVRLQRLREGRHVRLAEQRFVRLDGRSVYVEVASMSFVDTDQQAVQMVVRDISDRRATEEALRASEERYRQLVELSPDAILVHSEGRFAFANTAAARLLGADRADDLIGMEITRIVHPDDRQVVLDRVRREVEEAKQAPLLEEKFIRLDGTVLYVEVAGMPIVYQGRPCGQIVVRDVTARRRAEDTLRQRNAYLAALHETSLALMNRLNLQESLKAILTRAAALADTADGFIYLALPAEDVIEIQVALGLFESAVGLRLRRGEGLAGKVWATGEPLTVDDYSSWPGRADVLPASSAHAALAVPLKSAGEVVGVIGLSRGEPDVPFGQDQIDQLMQFASMASLALDNARLYTAAERELAERRQAEEHLRQAEARYRTLVEQIPAIVYVAEIGAHGDWLYVSPQIQSILGYTAEEWMAHPAPFSTHVHPDDFDRVQAEEQAAVGRVQPLSSEYRMLTRDGRSVWIRDEAMVVRDDGGEPIFWQGVMYDITARKRAEQKLQTSFIQERAAAERLRALDEMKNVFLSAVSHELRTPLAAVLGFAVTLERGEVKLSAEETKELVHRIAANARKLERLLADLLDLDRIGRGIMEPKRRPTDVAELVLRTLQNSDVHGERRVEIDADHVVVELDGPKVERIVENLLVNAARHTPPGTTIWVRVRGKDDGVTISVEDEGPGVPEALRGSIFEPFDRGGKDTSNTPGVGIGLTLVARFAEMHGGRAWVEDAPTGGAAFRVYLPGSSE